MSGSLFNFMGKVFMKSKPLALIGVVVALVIFGSFTTSDTARAQNAEKQNAIVGLTKMTGAISLTQHVMKQHLSLIFDLIETKNKDLTQSQKNIITGELVAGYNERKPDTIAKISTLYEKAFTHQEILDIVAFYKTPTGKKILRVSPKLAQDSLLLGKKLGEDMGRPLFERVWKRMKKKA
jgi:hypothetical protein